MEDMKDQEKLLLCSVLGIIVLCVTCIVLFYQNCQIEKNLDYYNEQFEVDTKIKYWNNKDLELVREIDEIKKKTNAMYGYLEIEEEGLYLQFGNLSYYNNYKSNKLQRLYDYLGVEEVTTSATIGLRKKK